MSVSSPPINAAKSFKVILARPRGFCAGVHRAIDTVKAALERFGPPVYVRHEIVHNEYVVAGLKKAGAVFTDDLSDVPEGSVLIYSAHGVSPEVRREAEARNLRIIDATCPLVSKIHKEALKYAGKGHGIFYIGHQGHIEALGVIGEAPDEITLVSSIAAAENMPAPNFEKLIYLTQTTLSIDETNEIVAALRRRFPNLEAPPASDICYATQNRQDALKSILPECGAVYIIGSSRSSNTKSLKKVASSHGIAAHLIGGPADLDLDTLPESGVVGVVSGASAPEEMVLGVIEKLRQNGAIEIEERVTRDENVLFPLPLLN